jgi:hypothetical protein
MIKPAKVEVSYVVVPAGRPAANGALVVASNSTVVMVGVTGPTLNGSQELTGEAP